jgi:hypothetical protein
MSVGAKGDYNTLTKTGTDDTTAFQTAINNLNLNVLRNKGGIVLLGNYNYYINGNITIPSKIILVGNNANVYLGDNGVFTIQKNAENIKFKGINFHGSLKYTTITQISGSTYGTQIKVANNVFSIGDKIGGSNYGISDKPYATITAFDGTYYTLDTPISTTGTLLNSNWGAVVGTFSWGTIINGDTNNNVIIEECTFDNARGYSICLPRTNNILINKCTVTNNGLDMLLFASDTNVPIVSNIKIINSVFDSNIDFGKQGITPIVDDDGCLIKNILIENCIFNKISESACSFGYANGKLETVRIRDNIFNNVDLDAVCTGGTDIIIEGNNIYNNNVNGVIRIGGYTTSVYSASSTIKNVKVRNNTINANNGITTQRVIIANTSNYIIPENIIIEKNTINAVYTGIGVNGNNIKVIENDISVTTGVNGVNCIFTQYVSDNIEIYKNNLYGKAGIFWNKTVTRLTIKENKFNPNGYNGTSSLNLYGDNSAPNTSIFISENIIYQSNGFTLACNAESGHNIEFKNNYIVKTDGTTIQIPRIKTMAARFTDTESLNDSNSWLSNIDNHWVQKILIPNVFGGYSLPTEGIFSIGDVVINQNPTEQGNAGSKYIIYGWQCITAPNTFLPLRTLTGN